jgi:hypothetical protein
MRVWNRVLVAIFLLTLVVPGAGLIAGVGRNDPAEENREPVPPPAFPGSWATLRAFPDAFTHYFEDAFAFRTTLVRWQSELRLRWLGVSATPDVIVGRDGWYYFATDGGIEAYTVPSLMSQEDLQVWARTLQDVQDWLAARGITYLFVIAPDKTAIYPEYMPTSIHRIHDESHTEELVKYLRAHSTVNVLDLRPALLEAKMHERVYHKTDTHWNERGAFAAYQAIARRVGLQPTPRSGFVDRVAEEPGRDLSRMLGLGSVMREENLRLDPRVPRRARLVEKLDPRLGLDDARLVTGIEDASLPRAVICRDSFGTALIPFLSEHFSRALYLWEYDVDPDVIARERPAIVIQEWVGRRLSTLLPYDPIPDLRRKAPAAAADGPGGSTP